MFLKLSLVTSIFLTLMLTGSAQQANAGCLSWNEVQKLRLKPSGSAVTARFKKASGDKVASVCPMKKGSTYFYLVRILRKNGKIDVIKVSARK